MFSLYPGRRAYQEWLHRSDLLNVTENRLLAVLPDTPRREDLLRILPQRDALFSQSSLCHRGGHTLTGLIHLNDTPVFLKRVDFTRKKFWGRLRYNLMPSRGLWSAFMASVLESAHLLTPQVLGAGEVRRHGLIAESLLFTEAVTVQEGNQYVQADCRHNHSAKKSAETLMVALRKLHEAGVTHGDLRLDNLYLTSDGTVGYWDLDSTLYWPNGIPALRRYRNTSCLIANLLHEADGCLSRSESGSSADFIHHCIAAYGACDARRLMPFIRYWLRRFDIVNFS